MEGLFISQENLQKLETYLTEQPYKFAKPIIEFFNQIKAEGLQEEAKKKEDEISK